MALRLAELPTPSLAGSLDHRLQVARRLDWRFLLADSRLERVVYLGDGRDHLVSALRAFASSLVELPLGVTLSTIDVAAGSFDLAVLQAPGSDTLRVAAALLRNEGNLYHELPPRMPRSRHLVRMLGTMASAGGEPLCSVSRTKRLLADLGVETTGSYCHHPSFEQCRAMVPIEHGSLGFYLSQRAGGGILPATVRATAKLLRPSWLAEVLPCVSVTGRKGPRS